jgi:hypothetical protein
MYPKRKVSFVEDIEEQTAFLTPKEDKRSNFTASKPDKDIFWKHGWAIHGFLILLYSTISFTVILSFYQATSERRQNGKSR